MLARLCRIALMTLAVVTATMAAASSRPSPGPSAIDFHGSLKGGQSRYYVVWIPANQPVIASIESRQRLSLSITGKANRRTILSGRSGKSGWQGTVATAQEYVFGVTSGREPARFILDLIIPRRIAFAKGAYSASVTGTPSAGLVSHYVVRARVGQTMSAAIASKNNTVALTIWGFSDGQPLVRGTASNATRWTGGLPMTQDYIIDAAQMPGQPAGYTLRITIK